MKTCLFNTGSVKSFVCDRGARAVGARGQYESQRQELFVQEEALVKCEFFDFKRVGEEKAKKMLNFVKQGRNRASFSEAGKVNQILIVLIGVQEQGVEQVFNGKG